jgi:hypothetical protein
MAGKREGNDNRLVQMLSGVGDILGAVHCLQSLGHTDTFLDWMKSYHKLAAKASWIDGYKVVLDVFLGLLERGIADNESLDLTEDTTLSRALFVGVPLRYVPNSCEKAIILRLILEKARAVLSSKTWQELGISLKAFDEEILSVLNGIKQATYVPSRYNIESIDDGIAYSSMFQLYIFLNDTSRDRPHGYGLSSLDARRSRIWPTHHRYSVRDVFDGYKYCVQFLWYILRGGKLDEECLADLHKPSSWREFDRFFPLIQRTIINPIEQKTGSLLGFNSVLMVEPSAKNSIERLISQGPAEARLSPKALLDRDFLWYGIKLIDASESMFGGIPAFIPVLVGSVQLRRARRQNDTLRVIRFVHPTGSEHRRDYSYAILAGLVGSYGLTDYSGWLLFFDCCADAGSTSALFQDAERYVRRYEKKGFLDVRTIEIDKHRFLSRMRHRIQPR